MNKNHLDIDDWYGEAAIGYCKGIATFDINKNTKISTYLFLCMLNQIRMAKRKKHLEFCSLDDEFCDGLHRIDSIKSENNEIADCEFKIVFQDTYNGLDDTYKKIIDMRLNGMTHREISATLNIAQPTVSRKLTKIRNRLAC